LLVAADDADEVEGQVTTTVEEVPLGIRMVGEGPTAATMDTGITTGVVMALNPIRTDDRIMDPINNRLIHPSNLTDNSHTHLRSMISVTVMALVVALLRTNTATTTTTILHTVAAEDLREVGNLTVGHTTIPMMVLMVIIIMVGMAKEITDRDKEVTDKEETTAEDTEDKAIRVITLMVAIMANKEDTTQAPPLILAVATIREVEVADGNEV